MGKVPHLHDHGMGVLGVLALAQAGGAQHVGELEFSNGRHVGDVAPAHGDGGA